MSAAENSSVPIVVVGGVYRERCMSPSWREVYGSAGRAASAMSNMGATVELHAYMDQMAVDVLETRADLEGFSITPTMVDETLVFEYYHGLDTPRIYHQFGAQAPLRVASDKVLRFGVLEGDAVVHGVQVVYDPQDPKCPKAFGENGSTAEQLALILNRNEAVALSGLHKAPAERMAERLIENGDADVVVIKLGPLGALVHDGKTLEHVAAFKSEQTWKIGSGDNFAAHFAFHWMHAGKSAVESARLASIATAYYCQTRGFATREILANFQPEPIIPSEAFRAGRRPTVYLAGPFFTLSQLWVVEQARTDLMAMGLEVFSPYHDVGHGSAEDVVARDLEGIDVAGLLFAVGDGMDSGTIYEVGYARAKGKPVVLYCENESDENKKMMKGSGCVICEDYVTAIYQVLWEACRL